MNFEFSTAGQILFGCGSIERLPGLISGRYKRIVLITGSHNRTVNPVHDTLNKAGGIELLQVVMGGEPDVDRIQAVLADIRQFQPDVIIGNGGGSVIDSAKAVAALYTNPGDVMDYLEVVGKGLPITGEPLPVIAIPTTAGTGSEVTRNAVLSIPGQRAKVSLRSPMMIPRVAIVDPELTLSLPAGVTTSTGLDALTQLIEPLISRKANPFVDGLCRQGISLIIDALPVAIKDGNNKSSRTALSLASLYGGMALANAGLGVVHAFAAAIGGFYQGISHGDICAAVLAAGIRANYAACAEQTETRIKIQEVYSMISRQTGISDAVDPLGRYISNLHIPGLRQLGVRQSDMPVILQKTQQASSMKGNPVDLNLNQLEEILLGSM